MKKLLLVGSLLLGTLSFAAEFTHESELGVVITGGNTNTEVISARTLNTYKINAGNILSAGGRFTEGYTKGVGITAKAWDAYIRYDRVLNEAWTLFVQQNIESDKFSGYAQRYNSDVGTRWTIVKTSHWYTFLEFGYRYTIENNVDSSIKQKKSNKLRLFYEIGGKINERVSGRFWAEYLPNIDESEDWILTFEPSLAISLSNIFSLKLSFRGIYQNEVKTVGNKKFDYIYTTGILAKF